MNDRPGKTLSPIKIAVLAAALIALAVVFSVIGLNPSTDAGALPEPTPPRQKPTEFGNVELDRSKPVPPKADVIKAWQKRQDAIKTLRFAWTEQQTYPVGWLPNPRFPERERISLPSLLIDRSYTVAKTLAVDGGRMRYSFELDRKEEPDGIRVLASPGGRTDGLGLRRHYSYVSTSDASQGKTTMTTLMDSPPPVVRQSAANPDAQNLDTRAILFAFRPLDPVMGHLLIDRAVTNQMRSFYKGKSIFLLEEQMDPSGWKTILWVEPERDFIVTRVVVCFEARFIADIDIDHVQDSQWGWIPSGWRVTAKLADDTKRLVTEAKVTGYTINQPIDFGF